MTTAYTGTEQGTAPAPRNHALDDLRRAVVGPLHTPQDPTWDLARMPWAVNNDQRPLAVPRTWRRTWRRTGGARRGHRGGGRPHRRGQLLAQHRLLERAQLGAGDGAVEGQCIDLLPGREADRRLPRDEAVAGIRLPRRAAKSRDAHAGVPRVVGGRDFPAAVVDGPVVHHVVRAREQARLPSPRGERDRDHERRDADDGQHAAGFDQRHATLAATLRNQVLAGAHGAFLRLVWKEL